MKIVKLYRKPDKPEFYEFIKVGALGMLVEYPLDVPYRKRSARWFSTDEVYVEWIREFRQSVMVTPSPLTGE
jgi:hypothetical protein